MPMGVPSPQAVDQTMNMSPMDLFDSIFWGELFGLSGKLELTCARPVPI